MSADRPSLDDIGRRYGIDQSSLRHGFLAIYERELAGLDPERIAIISGNQPVATANTFAEFYPHAEVHLIAVNRTVELKVARPGIYTTVRRRVDDIHRYLVQVGPVDLIVEDGTNKKSDKVQCFAELFYHLRDGGVYVIEDLHAAYIDKLNDREGEDVWAYLARLVAARTKARLKGPDHSLKGDAARAATIDRVVVHESIAFVTKSGAHYLKLHEDEAADALTKRVGDGWGEVLRTRPPEVFVPQARVSTNDPKLATRFVQSFDIPELYLREFSDVVCAPGQIATTADLLLPCSFHHARARYPKNRRFRDSGRFFARPKVDVEPRSTLPGTYYHLDSEFPGHYGHFITEDIAKLWGWAEARIRHPAIKLLLSVEKRGDEVKPFQHEILGAFGIGKDDVVAIDGPVRVDTLVAASQMFHNPIFISPALTETWWRIARALERPSPAGSQKLFVSRSGTYARRCTNGPELEALFAQHGFEVVYPELHPLGEQIGMFRAARVVAGYAGSALFNRIFAEGSMTQIVVGSASYLGRARNEYLIGGLLGDEMHYFQCPTDRRALHADYAFDFERDGPALVKLLEDL